jgi:predicted Zn-dependent protease
MRHRARLVAVLAVSLAACVRNPVTGKRQFSLVSQSQEIEMGKQAAEQVAQTIPRVDDPKLQAYVSSVGMRIAKASQRPNLPWSFTVLDDPSVNAFALPGGPIFITRGLLTYLNSEAELAGVLGHEIGHVNARHSAQQISKAEVAQVGLGVGSILAPNLAGLAQAAGAGLQLLFLKYSRDAERQADEIGFGYMVQQGYDPRQMVELFKTLDRSSKAESGGGARLPEWLATHPDPSNREKVAAERVAALKNPPARPEVDRDRYLAAVDGLTFGEDPRQGYFRGDTFVHPALKFQIQLPKGWKAQNEPTALVAVSPQQDAAVQLSAVGKLSPDEAARRFASQQGVRAMRADSGRTGSGLPATETSFQAQTQQGNVEGVAAFVGYGGTTYMLVGYAPAGRLAAHQAELRSTLSSFGPLKDPAAAAVSPARVELVTVPSDMTVSEFVSRFPSSAPLQTVATVNGVDPNGTLRAGERAKRIVGGAPLARR